MSIVLRCAACVLLAGCGAPTIEERALREQPHTCDPAEEIRPVAITPEPPPVCGDGHATSARQSCSQRCSYGCGEDSCGQIECEAIEERCDGTDFGAWNTIEAYGGLLVADAGEEEHAIDLYLITER